MRALRISHVGHPDLTFPTPSGKIELDSARRRRPRAAVAARAAEPPAAVALSAHALPGPHADALPRLLRSRPRAAHAGQGRSRARALDLARRRRRPRRGGRRAPSASCNERGDDAGARPGDGPHPGRHGLDARRLGRAQRPDERRARDPRRRRATPSPSSASRAARRPSTRGSTSNGRGAEARALHAPAVAARRRALAGAPRRQPQRVAATCATASPTRTRAADAESGSARAGAQTPVTQLRDRRGRRAVGGIGIELGADVFRRSAEIGYWLGEPFWGRGIATEALRAVTDYAFETFDICRLEAGVFDWNPASARVLEKAGYTLEGRARRGRRQGRAHRRSPAVRPRPAVALPELPDVTVYLEALDAAHRRRPARARAPAQPVPAALGRPAAVARSPAAP